MNGLTLAITTHKRTFALKRCLESVVRQKTMPDLIIVVDNDPERSAEPVVSSFNDQLPILYLFAEKQGTPFARNAAINNCRSDFLGFVDDDCILDPRWTGSGLKALRNKKITYVLGKSLLFNNSIIALAQYIHYSYWFFVKLKQALPYTPPMKFDTKNIIIRVDVLKKNRLLFNSKFSLGTIDSSDTDMGFRLEEKNCKGVFVPQMIVFHEETENLYRFLFKSYYRGRLAYHLSSKWHLSNELVCLPYRNWFTYFKSMRFWKTEYLAFMKSVKQSLPIKIIAFLLIKIHERVYLEGYLHEMSLSGKKNY